MYIAIIAAFFAVTSIPSSAQVTSVDHVEELIAERILDELEDNNDDEGDIRSAVRYMIPVPIRVVVPVPRQGSQSQPILAVPIGLSSGPYQTWRQTGPPVIAVPIGSASQYPSSQYPQYPDYDDYDYERKALSGELKKPEENGRGNGRNRPQARPHAGYRGPPAANSSPRRTRSINEHDLKIKNEDIRRRDLRLGNIQDSVSTKAFHGMDVPYKVSAKSWRSRNSGDRKQGGKGKHIRRKRQYYGNSNYYGHARYNRPTQIMAPAPPAQMYVPVPVPTQIVPVPVYVPVPVET